MCNENPVLAWLSAAGACIALAMLFIGLAIVLNGSFFGAPGSPVLMITAGIFSTLAVAALMIASSAVLAYFNCFGGFDAPIGQKCGGYLTNFLNALRGLATGLSIQALASFAAAGIAWIPWVGSGPMVAILGSLIVQLLTIGLLIGFYNALRNCLLS